MAFVYLVTNTVNGKRYVGKTKWSLSRRWKIHLRDAATGLGYALHRAIRKYGREAFLVEVVAEYDTEAEALGAEMRWIEHYETIGERGYNMCRGGRGTLGYRHTDEARAKQSAFAKSVGRVPSALALQRSADLRRGQPRSEETKARQAVAQSARRAEHPATDKFREKCRLAALERWAHATPRVLSDEERARRSVSSKASAPKRWATRIANAEDNSAPRLSIGEAAKLIGRSISTLCTWDRSGRLPARRTADGSRYYDAAELEAALSTFTFPKAGRPSRTKD